MSLNSKNILLVEDEPNLGKTLSEYLGSIGHHCHWAQNVKEAKDLYSSHSPDVILMDIGLPDGNGLELAREIRENDKSIGLLFLSALNDPETRLEGLELGGDDYITKPFALRELVLRLEKVFETQKSHSSLAPEITHGKLKIWFKKFEVRDANGFILKLSQKECEILQLLYEKIGEAVSREEIIEKIWGDDKYPSNRTVDNYIVKLRKWAETDDSKALEIMSIRSVGYKLVITK
ncbi:MAG: response regulator transcription factor [Bacteriovoracaceae bacterium]